MLSLMNGLYFRNFLHIWYEHSSQSLICIRFLTSDMRKGYQDRVYYDDIKEAVGRQMVKIINFNIDLHHYIGVGL